MRKVDGHSLPKYLFLSRLFNQLDFMMHNIERYYRSSKGTLTKRERMEKRNSTFWWKPSSI